MIDIDEVTRKLQACPWRWRLNRMLWEMGLSQEAGAGPQENGYVIRVYLYGGRASEHELA